MPRDGNDVYAKPAGTTAVANTVIESADYNSVVDDIVTDLNLPRPIAVGGTGATTVSGARAALAIPDGVGFASFAAGLSEVSASPSILDTGDVALIDGYTTAGDGGGCTVIVEAVDSADNPGGGRLAVVKPHDFPAPYYLSGKIDKWLSLSHEIWIDPVNGDDSAIGTAGDPVRTGMGAWYRLPRVTEHQAVLILKPGVHTEAPVGWDHTCMSGRPAPFNLAGRVAGMRTTRFGEVMSGVVIRGENNIVLDGSGNLVIDGTTAIIEAPDYAGAHALYLHGAVGQLGLAHLGMRVNSAAAVGLIHAVLACHRQMNRLHTTHVAIDGSGRRAQTGVLIESKAGAEMKASQAWGAQTNNWSAIAGATIDIAADSVDPIRGDVGATMDYSASSIGSRIRITTADGAPPPTGTASATNGASFETQGAGIGVYPPSDVVAESRNGSIRALYLTQRGAVTINGGRFSVEHAAIEAPVDAYGGDVILSQNTRVTVNTGTRADAIRLYDGARLSEPDGPAIFTGTAVGVNDFSKGETPTNVLGDNWYVFPGQRRQTLKITGVSGHRTGCAIGHQYYSLRLASAGGQLNERVTISSVECGTIRHVDSDWIVVEMDAADSVAPVAGLTLAGVTSGHSAAISTVNPMTPKGQLVTFRATSWGVTFIATPASGGATYAMGNGSGQFGARTFMWDGSDWWPEDWKR